MKINQCIATPCRTNHEHFPVLFFNSRELSSSVIQGLGITLEALLTFQYAVSQGYNEAIAGTMIFVLLIVANVFLTLGNRSFYYCILTTLKYENRMVLWMITLTLFMMAIR
jgi:Ca2+-transporting ATPase